MVVVTTFFPNPRDPGRTPFMRNLLQALSGLCELHVVAPVPRRPPIGGWRDRVAVPDRETYDRFDLRHPRYLALPGLHALSGLTYFLAVVPVLRMLRRELGDFVLHAHCAYPDAVGAALAARVLGLPLVITAHGSDINAAGTRAALAPQIRWALRQARRCIAVSRPLRERMVALARLPGQHVATVPCAGFRPETFSPRSRMEARERLGVQADARLVLFVGHMVEVKAVDVLLDAWARRARTAAAATPDCLVLVGEGDLRDRLQAQARAAGIEETVSFPGALPQPQVADWITACDVLCLPSHSEGSPNVVVEALASGRPVVATRVGGVPDLVVEGTTGLLVPPGDAAALAAGLDSALARTWKPEILCASVAQYTWARLALLNLDVLTAAAAPTPT